MQQQTIAIFTGATLLAIVGFLDDGGLLHHQVKLFIGMPVAALLLLASGIRAQLFSQFIPGNAGIILDGCLTVIWVVGITASFSILDHMDGLCAGITAVAAAFFTIAAYMNGQTAVQTLAAATLGAALGFLRWNFNPAKIFMGDGGAMFLGFLMATLGLKIRPDGAPFPAGWLVPVLILGVPIFDTTMVSISRARRGLLPFTSPGKDHTAHRLSNLGLGHQGRGARHVFAGGTAGNDGVVCWALFDRHYLCARRSAGALRTDRRGFPGNRSVREADQAAEILLHYLEEIPCPRYRLRLWRCFGTRIYFLACVSGC